MPSGLRFAHAAARSPGRSCFNPGGPPTHPGRGGPACHNERRKAYQSRDRSEWPAKERLLVVEFALERVKAEEMIAAIGKLYPVKTHRIVYRDILPESRH